MTVMENFKKWFVVVALMICAFFVIMHFVMVSASEQNLNKYYKSYTIKKGDTITSIAESFTAGTDITVGAYMDELRKNNELDDCDAIREGNSLIVTYYAE